MRIQVDPHSGSDFTGIMRILLMVGVIVFLLCGCIGRRKAQLQGAGGQGSDNASNGRKKLIVTPENGLVGQVAHVNTGGRFVVLNFPVGRLPTLEQRLSLYRKGLKVGEVKVTGPQYDDNVVADLLAGDSEVGDQVREK